MPDINTFDFWEGCNVHPLWDISDFTNLSREDFLTQCDQTVEDYVTEAVKLGYDEALAHIANQNIEIDLDDGVKVNYEKFQGIKISKEGQKVKSINLLKKI